MAKLRHIAMSVDDVEKTAKFYEEVFGLERVRIHPGAAVLLSDGVVSLAVIDKKFEYMHGHEGLHHIGFVVDDLTPFAEKIVSSGGAAAEDEKKEMERHLLNGRVKPEQVTAKAETLVQRQRKYYDPNGLDFDVANAEFAFRSWGVET